MNNGSNYVFASKTVQSIYVEKTIQNVYVHARQQGQGLPQKLALVAARATEHPLQIQGTQTVASPPRGRVLEMRNAQTLACVA